MKLWQKIDRQKIKIIIAIELIVFLAYSIYVWQEYEGVRLSFQQSDMQIQDLGDSYTDGSYLDVSVQDARAVVTPPFFLSKGVYYISFQYREDGIVKGGLIYDEKRYGKEFVDNDEFTLNPKLFEMSYRVTMKEATNVRFKLRLTGDAVEGNYLILDDFSIVQSKLTVVYRIFSLFLLLALFDIAAGIYAKFVVGGGYAPEGYHSHIRNYYIHCLPAVLS